MIALLVGLCTGLLVWLLHLAFAPGDFLYVYMPVIAAVAYLGGRVPAGIAGIASLITARYLVLSPVYSFSLPESRQLATVVLFAVVAAITIEAAVRLRDADAAARRLALIVESSDDAIFSRTVDGTILTWNASAERLFGYAPAEVIGRSVTILAPRELSGEVSDILARLRRGERVERYETVRVKKDGSRFDVSLSVAPIRGASGAVIGVSTIARDITDRKRVERQQRLLVEVGDALSRSLDVDANLEALATLLVSALADWCIIDLVGDDGTLRTAMTMHKDPSRAALAREVQRRYPPDPRSRYGSPNVVRTGKAELYPDVSDALLEEAVPNPALRSIIRSLGSRSAMVLPLTARGRSFGAMTLFSAESARRYAAADLASAEEVAQRAALALDNARLHHSEQVQRAAAERAADRVSRMQAITAALSEAVTPEQVADVIVAHALETFGGYAAGLSLLSPDGSAMELVRAVGYPSKVTQRWRRFSVKRHLGAATAIRTGRVAWRDAGSARDGRDSSEAVPFADALEQGGQAEIPLMSYGHAIGTLYISFRDDRPPSSSDLEFMLTVGRQGGQAIERARPYAREHRVAETLQRALLPAALPQFPGISVHTAYRSGGAWESDIGGDWYDVFWLPDGRMALSIGDVAGHGLRAAVTMGQLRQSIRAAALEHASPPIVLRRASELLALTDGDEAMATALFGVLDPNTSVLTYATAGSPAPILLGSDLEPARLACGGLPLGHLNADQPPSQTITLPRGSLLVLYTDGLVETRHDPIVGEAAVIEAARRELLEPAADHAEAIVRHVLAHGPIRDDIAVITVATARAPFDRFEIVLPSEPRSAVLIRQALRKLAWDIGLDRDVLMAIMVAVGEAVNNVIEHAYGATTGPVRVRARVDGAMLRVDVADEGTWRTGRSFTGGGHGLQLMKALVDVVEVDSTPAGTTVRLAMKLPGDAGPVPGAPAASNVVRHDGGSAVVGMWGAAEHPSPAEAPAAGHPVMLGIARADGIPVVTVGGDLDLLATDALKATLNRAARGESRAVIVSLGEAAYLDSHAIGVLLRFGRRLATNRRELLLVIPSSATLRRIVHAAGMGQAFKTFGTLAEAVSSVPPVGEAS